MTIWTPIGRNIINRLYDRIFMGDATSNSGATTGATGDWLTTFQLGTGRTGGWLQLSQGSILTKSTDPRSAIAFTIGSQTSNITQSGLNAIGSISMGINNNSSTPLVNAYASYNEAYRMSGALGGAYGYEIDTINYAGAVTIDPFSQDIKQTIGLQLASGGELSAANQFSSTAAINIRKNGTTYISGIIFGNDAINGTDGSSGEGEAIALSSGQVINYYYAASSVSWQLRASTGGVNADYSVTTSGTGAFSVPRLKANTVKFPATQVPSSDVNTLDDYEEGTFTPSVTFSALSVGVTYSTQVGKYTKIGNVVTFAIELVLTSKGSSTGPMAVAGLPFTVTSALSCAAAVRCASLAASATSDLQGLCSKADTTITITRFAAGASTQLADTDITNTSVIRVAGSYFVD